MHVLIPVYFRAPLGGLQSHVLAQSRALAAAGHRVTCLIRGGPFADIMRAAGFEVLETTYTDQQEALAAARSGGPYDLVHAHPFSARAAGLALARESKIPFALTFHGPYLDHIEEYGDEVDLLVTVSEAARERVLETGAIEAARVVVVPNGVDTAVFHPRSGTRSPGPPCVAVVSRLDPDKQIMLDAVTAAWEELAAREAPELRWLIAGDGASRGNLERAARSLEALTGRSLVTFLGWKEEAELADVYRAADVAVAPGRCALEALASGVPTIAVGSRGYGGPVDGAAALLSVHANFGGFTEAPVDRPALLADIERILGDEPLRSRMATAGRALAEGFFSQARVDRQLVSLAELLLAEAPRSLAAQAGWRPFGVGAPRLTEREDWRVLGAARSVEIEPAGDGLRITTRLAPEERAYVGRVSLSAPPEAGGLAVGDGEVVRLALTLERRSGEPVISAWLVQLDEAERVGKASLTLASGENELQVQVRPGARTLRLALRVTGEGVAELRALRLERRMRLVDREPVRPEG